jgi:CDGSH-type Zn-finger protein
LTDPRITIRGNGPLKIDGDIPLLDHEENIISTPEGRSYFLCRCGVSTKKPFCDGSHKDCGFDGALAPQED